MNRSIQCLLAVLVVSAIASASPVVDGTAAPTTRPSSTAAKAPKLPPPYDSLNLTDDQRSQVIEVMHAQRKADAEWATEHGARRAEIRKELTDVNTARDPDKVAALNAEAAALEKDRRTLDKKYKDQLNAILTLDQHQELEGRSSYAAMLRALGRAKLTEQQKGEIKTRVMQAEPDAYGKDEKTRNKVWSAVRADIEQNVLTPEQRLALKPAPTTHPAR